MTMDERVEALARLAFELVYARSIPDFMVPDWDEGPEDIKEASLAWARNALTVVVPELHGDQPKGWIAPWDVTTAMLWRARAAMRKAGLMPAYTDESGNGSPPIMNFMLEEAAWPAMRDAYLGKGDGG